MPIREKVIKSELTSTIDDFLSSKRKAKARDAGKDEGDADFLNIIEFIDKFNLLPQGLFPVQRFIVKLYYNITLDDVLPVNEKDRIKITDKFGQSVIKELTEKEYLHYLYDRGRCNIREQDGRDRRELILVVGRRSGKCASLDTRIPTDRGLLKLGDIVSHRDVGWEDSEFLVTKECGVQSYTDGAYFGGIQDVRTFTTYCGYSLTATPEHRVKVMSPEGKIEWKHVGDIVPGDHIAINRSSSLWASDHFRTNLDEFPILDDRLAQFLGLLVGDGTWGVRNRIEITGGCEQLLPIVQDIFQYYLGRSHTTRRVHPRNTCEISSWKVSVSDKVFRDALESLGYSRDCRPDTKRIPESIFRSPKSVVASFLRGLFEADGGLERGNTISFSSHSRQLCGDVQLLLLNFGIISRIRSKHDRRYGTINFVLNVLGGHSRRIFADEIGFITQRKQDVLLRSLASISSGCSDTESIPNQKLHLRRLRESIPKSRNNRPGTRTSDCRRSQLKEILGGSVKSGVVENISYGRLNRAIDFAASSGADMDIRRHFLDIIECNYFWDPVESVESGCCEVADISVPEGHEYVANGMTNHNSMLSSIFAAYEIYKLLRRGHPQSYYGAPSGNEIRILCVANDKEQASIVYGEMLGHVEAVDYFKSSVANSTQTYIKFRTEQDRKKYGDAGKATIMATFKSSIAKGLRGRGIMCAILDEIAFFVDDGKSSAERVYKAILPSIAQFSPKDPKNKHKPIGPTDGRVILISSPDAREGFFYRQYQTAMSNSKASENMLMIQAPTWEVNPTLSSDYYEVEYYKDPRSFMTEHGAEFSDRVRGWIEDYKDLAECIIPGLRPQVRGYPREAHFAGFDLGLTNDGSSVALTRLNQGRIELAYHEIWYPRMKWKDANPHLESPLTPYALTLQDRNRLDLAEIAEWMLQLSKRFFIHRGVFDQWTGIVFEQELHKRGLTQFEMRNFFTTHSSQAYQTFKMFMYNKQLALYDYPIPVSADGSDSATARHSPLISELLELQATSGGKNISIVEAPDAPGKHDDQSDALARSIMLAAEHIQAHPGLLEVAGVQQVAAPTSRMPGYHQYHRSRSRLHGGTPKERRLPRSGPSRRF